MKLMSWEFLKKHLSLVLIVAIGTLAVLSTYIAMSLPVKSRTPSSVPTLSATATAKTLILNPEHTLSPDQQKKGGGSLDLMITRSDSTAPLLTGSTGEFTGSITALADLADLEYIWILPDGARAVDGSVEGNLGTLHAGEKRTLTLSIESLTTENRQVYLHVYRLMNGEAVGQIAQYNTMTQPQINRDLKSKLEVWSKKAERGDRLHVVQ
jgi:hypothetical protein